VKAEDPALTRLMAAYQSGSIEAFDRLHEALASDLKAYLTMLTRDGMRADDLLQETFLQVHRSRAAHIPGQPVRPWVFAIARRVFLVSHRSASRRARYEAMASPVTGEGVAARSEQVNTKREIETALRQVAPDGRHAFLLHHLHGLSFKEIGVRLGINAGAAKVRSSRAAAVMRAWLKGTRDE
jgi:RNA polymerase sigma-70 factor (ECF subfamily)